MGSKPPEKKPNYRQEAEQIRAKAQGTRDAEARAQLLLIASLYDKLAEHIDVALQLRRSSLSLPEDSPERTDPA